VIGASPFLTGPVIAARCSIAGWHTSGATDTKLAVYCVGPPVDTPFVAGFTWSVGVASSTRWLMNLCTK
jgi:hypothetical protein